MALSTVADIETGVTAIFGALKDAKETSPAAYPALGELLRIQNVLNKVYAPVVDITLNDATDAGVSEAIAATGELGIAYAALFTGETTFPVGKIFQIGDVADFTDNALATAKGAGLADGDKFQVSGADAVTYLGADFVFTSEERADF